MFVSFQDFVGKYKELFCLKPGQIRQRRGIILNTGNLDCEVHLTLEICSLVNCLSSVKETFQTVKLSWKGGKVKQAELKEVNFGGFAKKCHRRWRTFQFLW